MTDWNGGKKGVSVEVFFALQKRWRKLQQLRLLLVVARKPEP